MPDLTGPDSAAGRAIQPEDVSSRSRRETWYKFVETTTAHGFSKFSSGSTRRKTFWLIVLILANVGFVIHLSFLVKRFFDVPVTSSRNEAPEDFQFPDVTFCPSSPISDAKMSSTFIPELGNRSLSQVASLLEPVWQLISLNASDYLDYPRLTLHDRLISQSAIYLPPEMVLMCQFYGYKCDLRNFTSYVGPRRLGCATFRAPDNLQRESPGALVRGLGIVGISLLSDASLASRYQSRKMSLFQGMTVTVHERGTLPNFIENTFSSHNSEYFVMRLSTGVYQAIQTPGNPCQKDRGNITVVTPGTGFTATYLETENICQETCLQDSIQNDCNCTSEQLQVTTAQAARRLPGCHKEAERYISVTPNEAQLAGMRQRWRCHQRWMLASRTSKLPCECTPYCDRSIMESSVSTYDYTDDGAGREFALLTFSQSLVPEYQAARAAINFSSPVNINDVAYTYESVLYENMPLTRTITQFEILPEVSKSMKVSESKTYNVDALCSDFGSIMGLWLGMSVLTVCEFLEMALRLAAAI